VAANISKERAVPVEQVAAMLGLTVRQVKCAEQSGLRKLRRNRELREAWRALQHSHSLLFGLDEPGRCERQRELNRAGYKERDFLLNTIGQALEEGAA